MGLIDPTSGSEETEQKPLAARVDTLAGRCVGLYDNGKPAAEPVLKAVEGMLEEEYPDITTSWFSMEHLNKIKKDGELDRVSEWAEDVDVAIGAIGDCGSCTKFLAWGVEAMEDAGTPAVGLIDEGFELDYQSNAIERGRPLRYKKIPVRCETTDLERVRREMAEAGLEGIEDELTRPLSEKERAEAVTQ